MGDANSYRAVFDERTDSADPTHNNFFRQQTTQTFNRNDPHTLRPSKPPPTIAMTTDGALHTDPERLTSAARTTISSPERDHPENDDRDDPYFLFFLLQTNIVLYIFLCFPPPEYLPTTTTSSVNSTLTTDFGFVISNATISFANGTNLIFNGRSYLRGDITPVPDNYVPPHSSLASDVWGSVTFVIGFISVLLLVGVVISHSKTYPVFAPLFAVYELCLGVIYFSTWSYESVAYIGLLRFLIEQSGHVMAVLVCVLCQMAGFEGLKSYACDFAIAVRNIAGFYREIAIDIGGDIKQSFMVKVEYLRRLMTRSDATAHKREEHEGDEEKMEV